MGESHRRCRATEQGKRKHREEERRRQARLRGEDVPLRATNRDKTHCPAGHPYDEANTYVDPADGSRRCRACANERVKAAYAADPEAGRQHSRARYARDGERWNRIEREQRAADPEKFRQVDRARYQASPEAKRSAIYRRRHNLAPGELEDIWTAQGGCCYLCGDPLPERDENLRKNSGSMGLPHMDHDHRHCPPNRSCGICRRGLACHRCNFVVGHAGDNPELLRRIAAALEVAIAGVDERMKVPTGGAA